MTDTQNPPTVSQYEGGFILGSLGEATPLRPEFSKFLADEHRHLGRQAHRPKPSS